VSFAHKARPWRFDFTCVNSTELQKIKGIKAHKEKFLSDALTPENFISTMAWDMVSSYEIEIEYTGQVLALVPAELNIIDLIFTLDNPKHSEETLYQDEIYNIAKIIAPRKAEDFRKPAYRLKRLANQVIALTKNTYQDLYPPIDYYITDKADGVRAIVSVYVGKCHIIFSDRIETHAHNISKQHTEIIAIADAEYVSGTLYLFDCMMHKENLSEKPFSARMEHLGPVAELIAALGVKCRAKSYIKVRNPKQDFTDMHNREAPYDTDGIIITSPGDSYLTTKNYKWKPSDKVTIDFLAKTCPAGLGEPYVERPGHTLYLLFVGIDHKAREKLGIGLLAQYMSIFPIQSDVNPQYYPVQFSPSINPLAFLYYHPVGEPAGASLDGQIIELSRGTDWIFHRVRTDRAMEKGYFGNDFRVAELTYTNYIDPFELKDLWEPGSSYFTKTSDDIYVAANRYKRFVISHLLKDHLEGSAWVIDEAAGRGADLHRYQEIGVSNALFIDNDAPAIAELIRRKFAFFAVKNRQVKKWLKPGARGGYDNLIVKDMKNLTVHTMVADLTTDSETLMAGMTQYGIVRGGIDGIVCNFALHYLCGTVENIHNFLGLNSALLKIGGVFMFVVMSGQKIFELLKDEQTWESRENNRVKYAIKRKYSGSVLTPAGQVISVLLPFAPDMYDEPLCNIEFILAEAENYGFEVVTNSSMSAYMDQFGRADSGLAAKLTPEDKKYIDMHSYVVLRKAKTL
jgi:hypothetical protein